MFGEDFEPVGNGERQITDEEAESLRTALLESVLTLIEQSDLSVEGKLRVTAFVREFLVEEWINALKQ